MLFILERNSVGQLIKDLKFVFIINKYIQTIQGRPYLRIIIDARNTGSDGNHHPRGLYTEVVYPDGSSDGYGPTQNIYNNNTI